MDRKAQDQINDLAFLMDQTWEESDAAEVILIETVGGGSYPTVPNVWYTVKRVLVDGAEEEGEPATLTPHGDEFLALHIGTAAPSAGSRAPAVRCGGAWVFQA